ncbi:MAG: hypothetical protein ACRDD7_03010 [Peptostreptococcaceae bacterium]
MKKEVARITGATGSIGEMLKSIGIERNSYRRFQSLVRNGRTVEQAIEYMKTERPVATTDLVINAIKNGIDTCPEISELLGKHQNAILYHLNKLMLSGVIECDAREVPYIYSMING